MEPGAVGRPDEAATAAAAAAGLAGEEPGEGWRGPWASGAAVHLVSLRLERCPELSDADLVAALRGLRALCELHVASCRSVSAGQWGTLPASQVKG